MKRKPDPRSLVVQPVKTAQQVAAVEDFWADPKREEALKMFIIGTPKMLIAKKLGVHRNTINNWCADPRFVSELNQRQREHVSAKRQRRLMSTNAVNDINERVTIALGKKLESSLKIDDDTGLPTASFDDKDLRRYREMASEFRETREQERIDIGDDIKKVAVSSQHTITGDVHVTRHGVNETSFTDYVRKALDDRVIDVTAIQAGAQEGDGQLLLKAAEHLLVDTDLLERINEEDVANEEASKQ